MTIKTPARRQWRLFSVFVIKFEQISHIALVPLFLTLSRCLPAGLTASCPQVLVLTFLEFFWGITFLRYLHVSRKFCITYFTTKKFPRNKMEKFYSINQPEENENRNSLQGLIQTKNDSSCRFRTWELTPLLTSLFWQK